MDVQCDFAGLRRPLPMLAVVTPGIPMTLTRLLAVTAAMAILAVDASPASAAERRVFHVRDYGAVPDGKTESGNAIRAAIAAAIAAAGTPDAPVEVVLEAGTYRVRHDSPRRGSCFPIHQATHVTVRGAGPAT
ncbi:MAG: hypothetical protein FJ276_20495, partial [Planctomycetes bacterium]|nr:hypothetical protein [Planctomycetota bacterium]